MRARLASKPSVVVVATTVVVVGAFVWSGDLRLSAPARPAVGAATADSAAAAANGGSATVRPRDASPVVVRVQRPARSHETMVRLRGRVFDTAGFLIVGADVLGGVVPARTDADGSFEMEVPTGVVDLTIAASGYRTATCTVATGAPDEPICVLEPRAPWDAAPAKVTPTPPTVSGEGILRAADGTPVVGAFVTALGGHAWSRTDEIGRYGLPLPGSPVTLLVHDPAGNDGAGRALRSDPIPLPRTSGLVPLPELELAPAASLRGTLRDELGNPAVGVPVRVRGEGLTRVLASGQSGAFRVNGLLPGRYEVAPLAFRGALGKRQQVVVDHAIVECEVRMHASPDLRVRVLDETGAPLPRAYVASAYDGERRCVAQADDDGYAAMRLVDPESHFEVRVGSDFVDRPVRRYEADTATLVVAAP